jgi:serine/threonine protein phosphatase 1
MAMNGGRWWFGPKSRPLPAIPAGQRVYAIGDVHGRLDLLMRLLGQIRVDHRDRPPARARIVLLGDLIDRGADSAGVVRAAMQPLGWAETIVLRGNHEAAMLAAIDGDPDMAALWLRNGGIAALESWGMPAGALDAPDSIDQAAMIRAIVPADQIAFLRGCALAAQIGDYHFVHAGVRPGIALDAQDDEDRLWIRQPFLESRQDHGAMIVHGHTISEEPECHANRIGIDTGAYRSGRLTALGLEATDRWLIQT